MPEETSSNGSPAEQALPEAGFMFDRPRAALVVIDPQNDFLSGDAYLVALTNYSFLANAMWVPKRRCHIFAETGCILRNQSRRSARPSRPAPTQWPARGTPSFNRTRESDAWRSATSVDQFYY